MTITLPDDSALQGLDEARLRLDLACGLFAAGRISRGVAARIAGLGSLAFDGELFRRRIPSFIKEMLDQDLAALERLHRGEDTTLSPIGDKVVSPIGDKFPFFNVLLAT